MKKMILVTVLSLTGLIIFSRVFFGTLFLENYPDPSDYFLTQLSTSLLLYGILSFFLFFMAVTDWRRPFAHIINFFINVYIWVFEDHGNYRYFDEFKEKTNDTIAITGTFLSVLYIISSIVLVYNVYGNFWE